MFNGKLVQASANFGCFMTVNVTNPASAVIPETFRVTNITSSIESMIDNTLITDKSKTSMGLIRKVCSLRIRWSCGLFGLFLCLLFLIHYLFRKIIGLYYIFVRSNRKLKVKKTLNNISL